MTSRAIGSPECVQLPQALETSPETGMRGLRAKGTIAVALAACVLSACANPGADLLSSRLEDGTVIRDLVAASPLPTAVLVYSSGTCFSCSTPLSKWQDAARKGRLRLLLLIAGPAPEAERRALRIHRVPVSGFLAELAIPVADLPVEYLLENGRVVDYAKGMSDIQESRLWQRALAEYSAAASLTPELGRVDTGEGKRP